MRAIIFDVDGVLVDSVELHFSAWKQTFANQGIRLTYTDYLKKINGLPRDQAIKNVLPHLSVDKQSEIARQKQLLFLQTLNSSQLSPKPGVISFIKKLKKLNYRLAASSSSRNARLLLNLAKISPHLDLIITGDEIKHPKPHPETFVLASKRLGINPTSCVVVEDASVGIQAAKKGGMRTIGIASSQDDELNKYADLLVNSLKEQRKIISFLSANVD